MIIYVCFYHWLVWWFWCGLVGQLFPTRLYCPDSVILWRTPLPWSHCHRRTPQKTYGLWTCLRLTSLWSVIKFSSCNCYYYHDIMINISIMTVIVSLTLSHDRTHYGYVMLMFNRVSCRFAVPGLGEQAQPRRCSRCSQCCGLDDSQRTKGTRWQDGKTEAPCSAREVHRAIEKILKERDIYIITIICIYITNRPYCRNNEPMRRQCGLAYLSWLLALPRRVQNLHVR